MSNFVLKDDQKKIMLLDFRISALTPLPSELSCFMLTCQQSGEPFPLERQDPVHTVNNRLGGVSVSGEKAEKAWERCSPVTTQSTLFCQF